MKQETIDNISDMLQGRNSEHREYPFGHPKYRPPKGALLPYLPGTGWGFTVDFGSDAECKRFFDIFQSLGDKARERTVNHLADISKIKHMD